MEIMNEAIEGESSVEENPAEEAQEKLTKVQVAWWQGQVEKAKLHWKDQFDAMKEDMAFARGTQWPGQKNARDQNKGYVANIVHRHLRQQEASLYAKNPTAVASRRNTLDYMMWSGDMQEVQMAQQTMMQLQQMGPEAMQDPNIMQMAQQAQAMLEDYKTGSEYRKRVDRMGETLEIVWEHQIGEQQPPFKKSMKHLVRRTLTTSIAYVKLGYHRFNEMRPEDVARVTDLTEQVSSLEAGLEDMKEGDTEYDETSVELAELNDLLAKVKSDQEAFMREGLDFDYPRSTSIIVDPACYQLDGFLGARYVVQEFVLTPKQVSQVYKVDIDGGFTPYTDEGSKVEQTAVDSLSKAEMEDHNALVWEIWDKHQGQTLTICQGHDEFLIAPKTPDVHLERFWPFFTLIFNGVEDENDLYPPSDVELLRPMQMERNLMRQRVREHRDAALPGHVVPKGRLDQEDKDKLGNRVAHDVIELNGLTETDDIRRILQPVPTNPIDPNQYETSSLDEDVYRSVGSQEAVLGGTSGASATETSIGESARLTATGSFIDELDDFLTELTKSASHLMLTQMSAELVKEIAGRGAEWPELTGAEVARDLWLEIRAGSSGRPNKSAEIQNVERVMPFLLQIPGIKPKNLAEMLLDRMDDKLDVDDLYDENIPSVIAQNSQSQVSTGDPSSDPNQQGAQGGNKARAEQGDTNLGPRAPEAPRVMDPNR